MVNANTIMFQNETFDISKYNSWETHDNCILFIFSNSPNLGSIIHKYNSIGFKFKNILIYSKKYSMVKSYKKSKLFVYVFTKGNCNIVNQNFYGSTTVPVMSQEEIYKDLLQNKTREVIDFNAITPLKEHICSEKGISYRGFITGDSQLYAQIKECIFL